MKTRTSTTLIFLISVTFATIIADDDSKLTLKSAFPSIENPLLSILNPGNILHNVVKDLTKLTQSNDVDALRNPSTSTIETAVNSVINSEYLKNLAILKTEIDCNLLNVIPDAVPPSPVNLKSLICQTLALSDYLENHTVGATFEIQYALQSLLTGILQNLVRILRNIEPSINELLAIPEKQSEYPVLRVALNPAQFDKIVRSSRDVEAVLAPRILRDVVNETSNILSGEPLRSLNGLLLDCDDPSNDTAEDIRDILDGKLTYCGLNWAIRALSPAVDEAYERSRLPTNVVPSYIGNSTPIMPLPRIPVPWPANFAPSSLNPIPFPLNSIPFPLNPGALPTNPTPLSANPTENSVALPSNTAFNADANEVNTIAADLANLVSNCGALLTGKPDGEDVSADSDVNSTEYSD